MLFYVYSFNSDCNQFYVSLRKSSCVNWVTLATNNTRQSNSLNLHIPYKSETANAFEKPSQQFWKWQAFWALVSIAQMSGTIASEHQ